MNVVGRVVAAAALVLLAGAPTAALQQQPPNPKDPKPTQKPEPKPDEPQKYEETVVVSASKTEEKLVNAPATMTVLSGRALELAPTQHFGDLMRTVPGLNVTQVSARDINLTSRAATGTLATGQLALLDGRSMYQDFFGFVMWDFLPVNFNEIKQIEVIRGPASAVWGANAVNGVVNVITKSPREMAGTSAVLGFGGFDRDAGLFAGKSAGSLWYLSGTHAQAVNDRWSFKVSAGGYSQDALARPTGLIPGSPGAGTPYPRYDNEGTTQPKFDARFDYDYPDGRKLSFSGGASGTEGIMHSGIGPFDIKSGSIMSYGKVNFSRAGLRAAFFVNSLDGDAANLLTRTPTNAPITFDFATKTFDLELSNVSAVAKRHVFSYGGNLRYNRFDLSLAPNGDNRTEFGIYGQDEIFLSEKFRLVAGGRIDRFDYIDDVVFSPRVTFMFKPVTNHTLRVSYNRAYRSPSVVNNFLEVTIAEPINLGLFHPLLAGQVYPLPIRSIGNENLQEMSLDAFETSYTGQIGGRLVVSMAYYYNRTKNDIFFTEDTAGRWTHLNVPPGWPAILGPGAIFLATQGAGFPGRFTYRNFGKTTQPGFEFGVDGRINQYFDAFFNYSWQDEPKPDGFALSELNLPPTYRANGGISFNYKQCFGNVAISHTDGAFWQDVLDARYSGVTETYTLVNTGLGVRWGGDRMTTAVKVFNLGNAEIQQHVFGDILKRQIVGEFKVQF